MTIAAHQCRDHRQDARDALAELIASGQATCDVETAGRIWGVGRCTSYEIAETLGAIRVGRKLRCSVPHLLKMLDIPLPEKWLPGGALSCRCHDPESERGEAEGIIPGHGAGE